MSFKLIKKLNKKTHTKTVLIYKTSPYPHWLILLIIALCIIGGIVFLIYNYSDLDLTDGFEILGFWAVGLIIVIELKTTQWHFNKKTDLAMITTQYVVFKRTHIKQYKLSEIEKIFWEKEKISLGKFADIIERYHYPVYIQFKTDTEEFNVFKSEKEAIENVKQLKAFLQPEESD